jgi:adenylate cyclase
VALEKRTVQIPDVFADAEFQNHETARAVGFRATIGTPLLRDGEPIGFISLLKETAGPFTHTQVQLLESFADQAVIAIENTRLFEEVQARTRKLARSVDEQRALGEIGRMVSSSLDLSRVLQTVTEQASTMAFANGGAIYVFDGEKGEFRLEAAHDISAEAIASIRAQPLRLSDPLIGECGVRREAVQVADLNDLPATTLAATTLRNSLVQAGVRAVLAVPLLHKDDLIGALAVRRSEPGVFSPEIVRLLEAFAAQSAIALKNARLFEEVQDQSKRLAAQSEELEQWNHTLQQRVNDQLAEIERMNQLKRFLSPQVAGLVISSGGEQLLESHRRQITVLHCDLRGFTAFAETSEPEEVIRVLREYHEALGALIHKYEATLERFAGDGVMVWFNDPIPCPDPRERAVRMAVEMRTIVTTLIAKWRREGHDLGFGVGIAHGYATLGRIGFEGRYDYAAVGTVVNLAARLCSHAQAGQILIDPKVHLAAEAVVATEPAGELTLKGLHRPVAAFNVCAVSP